MKPKNVIFLSLFISLGLFADSAKKPNLIYFISDDHGARDSGAYGNPDVKTPNVNRFAKQGMLFIHAFAQTPLCSPSRSSLTTGMYPFRSGAYRFGTPIKKGTVTLPVYFRKLGYHTVHFGKFHHTPKSQYPYDHVNTSRQHINKAQEYLANYKGKKPLMMVVCTYPPHQPWVENIGYDADKLKLPPNFVDTPETREMRTRYYSDVTLMDSYFGKILDAVDSRADKDNTFVVHTTDQGAMWPFGKWCVYDDGLRVPLIVRGPGIEAHSTSSAIVELIDVLPTLMELGGGQTPESPKEMDGKSFLNVLYGKSNEHRNYAFGTHSAHAAGGKGKPSKNPARTVRDKQFRYILNLNSEEPFICGVLGNRGDNTYWPSWEKKAETDAAAKAIVTAYLHRPKEEFYDVIKDPYEMNNLIANPEYAVQIERMRSELANWRRQQHDTVPMAETSQ